MPSTRGRQREAAVNDQRVLDAARIVFARDGWDAPVSAVAAEAGVGIGSLYRRYGSKTELLQDLCTLSMQQSIAAAEQALREAEPWHALRGYIVRCVDFGAGAFAPLARTIPVTDNMITTAKVSQRLLAKLVRRAQAAGALRGDVNGVDITAIIQRFSCARPDFNPDAARLDRRLLAITLDGLTGTAAANRSPLPRAVTRHSQAQAWIAAAPPGERL